MVHDTSICGGDSALLQASGAIGYLWKLGAGRTSIFNPVLVYPQNSYKYQVVGTDANGCKDSVFEQVSVYPAAVSISAIPDSTVVIGTELHLLANLLQITDSIISWQPEEVIGNANTNPIISTPKQSQMYCVITKNSLGCIAEACIHIKVIPVDDFIAPTAFSPNGDGLNDWFRLTMSPNMELLHFIIVNRWGEEVFNAEQDQHGSAWDGIYNNREQPMGTFVWYAEAKNRLTGNKVIKSGNVTLLR
jgi:gliding motility-associated-like protein